MNRLLQRVASTKPVTWLYLNVFPLLDRPLLRLSRGRLSVSVGQPVLLLETRGARTGQLRTTPLVYVERGSDIVIVASNGGNERHPAWYYNLRAHPVARVTVRGEVASYTAREATGDERDRLWKEAVGFYLGFERYQRRAGARRIPVMVLSPTTSG